MYFTTNICSIINSSTSIIFLQEYFCNNFLDVTRIQTSTNGFCLIRDFVKEMQQSGVGLFPTIFLVLSNCLVAQENGLKSYQFFLTKHGVILPQRFPTHITGQVCINPHKYSYIGWPWNSLNFLLLI